MDTKLRLGQRLRDARKARGLSRRALSEIVPGLNPSTLSGYEYGVNEPPFDVLKRLAKALGVSPIKLLDLEDEALDLLGEKEKRVVTIYRTTNEQGRDAITSVAESQWTYAKPKPNKKDQDMSQSA